LLTVDGVKEVEVDYSKAVIGFDPNHIPSTEALNQALEVYGYQLTTVRSSNE
jgi:copper chaperone CopZ